MAHYATETHEVWFNSVFLENIKQDDWEVSLYESSKVFVAIKKVLIARTSSFLLLLDLIVNIMCFKPIDIERKGLCMLCNKKLS